MTFRGKPKRQRRLHPEVKRTACRQREASMVKVVAREDRSRNDNYQSETAAEKMTSSCREKHQQKRW